VRAVVEHPAGCEPPLARIASLAEAALAFRHFYTLGTRDFIVFVAAYPTAHMLACLRFAGRVTVTVARLATGRAGSPLAGRGSHPLDDERSFIKSLA